MEVSLYMWRSIELAESRGLLKGLRKLSLRGEAATRMELADEYNAGLCDKVVTFTILNGRCHQRVCLRSLKRPLNATPPGLLHVMSLVVIVDEFIGCDGLRQDIELYRAAHAYYPSFLPLSKIAMSSMSVFYHSQSLSVFAPCNYTAQCIQGPSSAGLYACLHSTASCLGSLRLISYCGPCGNLI